MDEFVVPRKRLRRVGLPVLLGLFALTAAWALLPSGTGKHLTVDKSALEVATVQRRSISNAVQFRGQIQPRRTIYLDAVEGGRVEKRFVEAGSYVKKGQPLVALSNPALQLSVISREADISQQLNNLRNTRLNMETERLNLKSQLLDINHHLATLERQTKEQAKLKDKAFISRDRLAQTAESLQYYRQKKQLTLARQQQNNAIRQGQLKQLEENNHQLQSNLALARNNLKSLTIKAPAAGFLSVLDAEQGESKAPGSRLGQLDLTDSYKVKALVDEFYLNKVTPGMKAHAEVDGKQLNLLVKRVSGRVQNNQFAVELTVVGSVPKSLHLGQSVNVNLPLDDHSSRGLTIPNGPFMQQTGGHWLFVLTRDGRSAHRQPIKIGKRNSNWLEVTSGLTAGEQVVLNGYDNFTNITVLDFN